MPLSQEEIDELVAEILPKAGLRKAMALMGRYRRSLSRRGRR
jgi:hypothetical protein